MQDVMAHRAAAPAMQSQHFGQQQYWGNAPPARQEDARGFAIGYTGGRVRREQRESLRASSFKIGERMGGSTERRTAPDMPAGRANPRKGAPLFCGEGGVMVGRSSSRVSQPPGGASSWSIGGFADAEPRPASYGARAPLAPLGSNMAPAGPAGHGAGYDEIAELSKADALARLQALHDRKESGPETTGAAPAMDPYMARYSQEQPSAMGKKMFRGGARANSFDRVFGDAGGAPTARSYKSKKTHVDTGSRVMSGYQQYSAADFTYAHGNAYGGRGAPNKDYRSTGAPLLCGEGDVSVGRASIRVRHPPGGGSSFSLG